MNTNKPIIKTLATLALLALATIPVTVSAVIAGSKHDFSGKGWRPAADLTNTETCMYCHTPHAATAPASGVGPLWNRAASTTATFTLYTNTNGTLNATPGQPGPTSKTCMSCHDGTVAMDSYGTRVGSVLATGALLIGPSLANDHPIAFTYNAALATLDGELTTPASATSVTAALPLFAVGATVSQMECSTCHDAHGGIAGTKLLRLSNAASALCRACHVK